MGWAYWACYWVAAIVLLMAGADWVIATETEVVMDAIVDLAQVISGLAAAAAAIFAARQLQLASRTTIASTTLDQFKLIDEWYAKLAAGAGGARDQLKLAFDKASKAKLETDSPGHHYFLFLNAVDSLASLSEQGFADRVIAMKHLSELRKMLDPIYLAELQEVAEDVHLFAPSLRLVKEMRMKYPPQPSASEEAA